MRLLIIMTEEQGEEPAIQNGTVSEKSQDGDFDFATVLFPGATTAFPETLPDPAAPPPPTSQVAPLSPHSLRPHPPATPSVIVQPPNEFPRVEDVPSAPPSINEREETPIEFPDPKSAPPDTYTQAPIDPHDLKPRGPSSPSLIVEPPADPRPVDDMSAVVSRAATPVRLPDPRLPPIDSYLEAPITPHHLKPRSRAQTESLMVEDGHDEGSAAAGTADEAEKAEVQNEEGTFDEGVPMAPEDGYEVELVERLEREEDELGDEAGKEAEIREPVEAESVEKQEEQSQKAGFDVYKQAEDRDELVEEKIEIEKPSEEAESETPEQDNEDVEDKYGPKDKGKGKAFSPTPIDEEHVLNDDLPSEPVLVDAAASPERPPLIMTTSAIERLRHHHNLASGAVAAVGSQSSQTSQTQSQTHTHRRTRSRARAEGSPPPPPVTRSNCYYEKLKVADYGLEAIILAPHCSLANVEQIEKDEAIVQGVPTEEEEQEARKCQMSHDNEVLHPVLCTKIRRIVGLQIFDEGCCYLLYANKGARLAEEEEGSSNKTETPTGTISRGHRKRKSTSAQLGEQSTTASPIKPRASPIGTRSALKRSGVSLEPPESFTPRKKSKERSLEPAGSYTTEVDVDVGDDHDHSTTGSPRPSSSRRLQTPRRSTRLSSIRREEVLEETPGSEKDLEVVQEGETEADGGQEEEREERGKTVEEEAEPLGLLSEAHQTPRRSARFLPAEEIDDDQSPPLGSITISQSESVQRSPAKSALHKTPLSIRKRNNAVHPLDEEDEEEEGSTPEEDTDSEEEEETAEEDEKSTSDKKRKARDESEEEKEQEDEGDEGNIELRVVKRRALEDEETGTPVSENEAGESAPDGDTRKRGWGKWLRWW